MDSIIKLLDDINDNDSILSSLDNKDIFLLDRLKRDKYIYNFNGMPVPRVSEILDTCIGGNESLMKWAASHGSTKEYIENKSRILKIGSTVHEMIEHFLIYKEDMFLNNIYSQNVKDTCNIAYRNFRSWYRDRINEGYNIDIKGIEYSITCPWYGGTIDCIAKFTNENWLDNHSEKYIIDFKTSSRISINYLLQTFAYLWAYNWNIKYYGLKEEPINGIGIIRVDKNTNKYEHLFISYGINDQYMIELESALSSMINWYYNYNNIDIYTREIRKELNRYELDIFRNA